MPGPLTVSTHAAKLNNLCYTIKSYHSPGHLQWHMRVLKKYACEVIEILDRIRNTPPISPTSRRTSVFWQTENRLYAQLRGRPLADMEIS